MLIDVKYFMQGSRHIQNATTSSTASADQLATNVAIEGYIQELQPEFLHAMIGDNAVYIEDYLRLKEENEFEDEESQPSKYEAVCDRLKEPFADYVLFHILKDANVQTTVTGRVRLKCANEYISPMRKQVSTWNSMVRHNLSFLKWAQEGKCPIDLVTETNMLIKINSFNL